MSRRSLVLELPLLLLLSGRALGVDLKVTDTRGMEVLVTGASIDYSGFVAADREIQGIRVYQGEGTVTVKWSDIQTVTVAGKDDSVKPPRLKLEIVLRNGKKVPAALFRQGQMKLVGKTDLGEYSIDLEKVRAISPVR